MKLMTRPCRTALVVLACGCTAPKSDPAAPVKSTTASESTTATDSANTTATDSATATATESATDTETADGTVTDVDAGTLALGQLSESEMVLALGTALVSVAQASDGSGATLNPGTVALSTSLNDPEVCKASGSPSVETGTMPSGQYAGLAAYCDLAKHPDGPDTTLGGIDRIQGLLCALGKLTYDGEPRDISMRVTSDCFSETFIAMAVETACGDPATCPDGVPILAHTVTAMKIDGATNDGYDHSVKIDVPEGGVGFAYELKLKQTEDLLAAAIYEQGSSATDGGTFAVSLSTGAPATIRYEGRFIGGNEGPTWYRHLRVVATGTIDEATHTYSAIDSLQYVAWDTYGDGGAKFMSVRGSPAAGFRAVKLSAGDALELTDYDLAVHASGASVCYGSGTCDENDGILVTTESDLGFIKTLIPSDASFLPFADWYAAHGPLQFTAVSLSAEQD